jgi:hypothetical protein
LKTLEKINRKAIRNSLEIEKAISAHLAQASLALRAPPVPDRRVPPVGANQRALSPPLSLPRGPDLSVLVPSRAPTLPLSAPPSPPVSRPQPSAHDLPVVDRSRPRVLRPRPCARALLAHLSSLICVVCPTLSPSLSLYPREQRAPPPPPTPTACSVAAVAPVPHPVPR